MYLRAIGLMLSTCPCGHMSTHTGVARPAIATASAAPSEPEPEPEPVPVPVPVPVPEPVSVSVSVSVSVPEPASAPAPIPAHAHAHAHAAAPAPTPASADPPKPGKPAPKWSEVKPLFAKHCDRCHGASPDDEETAEKAKKHMDTSTAPFRGHEGAKLYKEIAKAVRRAPDGRTKMPADDRRALKDEEIARLQAWIAGGHPFGD